MSKHGIDLLKRRLRDKISGLQSDTETIKARLESDNDKLIQANLKRCEEKLNAKLEASFTRLYEILEQYKREFHGKVDALFSHHRQAITNQNKAVNECLASVNKACADGEELLRENDRSAFLAAHNKVSQRLEECFVELLMLDESDSYSLALAKVESVEEKIESFCLNDQLPPFEAGMKTTDVKDCNKEQEFKTPVIPIPSPLIPTTLQKPATSSVKPFDVTSSIHLPFVFTSPPSSIPTSSNAISHHTSPKVTTVANVVSFPVSTPSVNIGFSVAQNLKLPSVSSGAVHRPPSTTSTTDKATVTMSNILSSSLDASLVSELVPKVVNLPQSTSTPMTKVTSSETKTQTLASVSTSKSATCSKSIPANTKGSVSVTTTCVHSVKVTNTKNSSSSSSATAAASNTTLAVKKPKMVTSTVSAASKHSTISYAKMVGYLPNLKQGDEIECVVTEVVSPSEFWVQPANYELISLMNNMEFYYMQLGDHGGLEELPKVGDFCCARYSHDSRWYRARILSVNENGISHQVGVVYIDYGNQEEVALSSLRPLDSRFSYLPCQAIKCSLKVKPFVEISSPELKGSGIPQWPQHTKKWFKSLLMGKHVTVMFLTANTSNHAQVDIGINREMFLPSLSCLHGVLSITEGIKQFLKSTHFFSSFGVSSFMCLVKLAIFIGDQWLANHSFCGPSVFTLPAAPGPIFMQPFSAMSPQYPLFPVVRYCNPPSLPTALSSAFIQPCISPASSLNLSDETSPAAEPRCHSEKPTITHKSILKKRTASLSGTDVSILSNPPTDLQFHASCDEKVTKKLSSSKLEDKASPDVSCVTVAPVVTTSNDDSLSPSVLDVTAVGLECSSSLSISSLSHSSKSSILSSHSSSGLCESNPVTTVPTLVQSVCAVSSSPLSRKDSISSLPSSNGHREVDNYSPQASSPLPNVTMASKSPECKKNTVKAMATKDDCIKFYTIAALPMLSSVISNDSDHYSVIVSHVISPSEFYLNFASDAEEVKNFDSFQQSLYDHYSNEKEEEDLSKNLTIGVLCSAKYTDGTWNRGIIRDIQSTVAGDSDENKSKYLVQYIDYGNYHWISIDNIRSLQEEFLSQPALTIRCSLSGVVPSYDKRWRRRKINLSTKMLLTAAGSEDDLQEFDRDTEGCMLIHDDQDVFESAKESKDHHHSIKDWSQESTDRFMHLTNGKVLVAVLNEEVMMLSWDDVLEVQLIDTNGATDLIIADELVSRGLARYKGNKSAARKDKVCETSYKDHVSLNHVDSTHSTLRSVLKTDKVSSTGKVAGAANPLSPSEADMDSWNPMESHFLSNWNLYQESNCGLLHGDKVGSVIFGTRGAKQDTTIKDPATMVSKSWKTQTVSLPAENSCIPIVITAVYSPVKFWAQLYQPTTTTTNAYNDEENRNKYEVTLAQLCEEMNKQYSRSVFKEREPEMIAHGELVAAMSPEDQCWYRAVLKDFDDNANTVLVAFVDYGDTAWISEAKVRRLHPKFVHLPIQAVECTLDGLKVNEEVDVNWAVQEFLEMVKNKGFAAHVIERDTVLDRLSLELYDSNTSGTFINLKNVLLSKKIAVRTTTAIGGSLASGGHKKNTSSLPG